MVSVENVGSNNKKVWRKPGGPLALVVNLPQQISYLNTGVLNRYVNPLCWHMAIKKCFDCNFLI